MVELLAPAGNLEKLKTAIDFGADAVYLGGSKLNLRAFADNFENEELIQGIKYAHERGKKVYITLNVFPHNEDLIGLEEYLRELYEIGADALIVSDPAVIATAKEIIPKMELHLSTQANNVNWKSCEFWHKQGVKRIVLARELSFDEIKEIRSKLQSSCEIELFVHGSMCISYSGRCLLSNYLTGRDSNRGQCAQPCRYKYYLMEEKRPGQYFPISEDKNGTYIMNSKDLCMIKHIPELIETGAVSFKIEGRMKSSFYVAAVVKAYRQAIDSYYKNPSSYVVDNEWLNYLNIVSHRQYTTGFYLDEKDKQIYNTSSYIRDYDIIGLVKQYDKTTGVAVIEQRNKVFVGDRVQVLSPNLNTFEVTLKDMKNFNGDLISSTPVAQMIYTVQVNQELKANDMLIKCKGE